MTPRAWAEAQLGAAAELLLEQAHLEKKAAAAAMQFLFRLPVQVPIGLHRELSALAREELVHFERTLRLLGQRGLAYGPQPPSDYAGKLKAALATTMPERLVDELLASAVIEDRSHERLLLLAEVFAATDAPLADFYADLAAAESRHGPTYVEVAAAVLPADVVVARHARLRAHEAAVLHALPFAHRLHSGWPES
ncbi:MAG: tRNA-(ms[2]io[6]A)-hydroxylase [Planctomycetes bacterium]|nr:tRNA-(ms[2]io[6]A)-hydroxylase [Planctomycetota bacterium]